MYISEQEVRAVLTYDTLIPAIRQALIDFSAGRVNQPPRMILRAGNAEGHRNGWFAIMPVVAGDFMAVKTVTWYPANDELGLHTHMAVVELLNRATGEPLALMDGRLITEMRTAAVSAVAFSALAPAHFETAPRTLGILGSGVQARAHITALRQVWPELNDIRIWSRNPANAKKLAGEVGATAATIEQASSAEVVLTVTSAQTPVLRGELLRPNALILAVGATGATIRELDDAAMLSSFIVAESRSCVERESGDLLLSGAKVHADLGEILANPAAANIPRDRRVISKSVGMAVEDLTAARLVWQARQSISPDNA
ncbi:ornithine cyclodeaminase family protein [Occallatibacter savannae]|uniref:ornithine cyclodeaminase family protein n=1 Tax=Occallatibacter savannae TaxID=1002691 RepID=UPI000D6984F3|nr:ornithine cyclodeaminase family protein [Occallatibacter savannae]